ncbi:hypothetical protein OESDEN_11246 [Oesophagostomum dentatum]|uniref:Uncharacterized protein n=1 Tax=Oesophagostomum dentatum TaxID=61180 RepID=A0A0B1SVF5_OESDE|nr:hypothetical protein OESDEN_11246 [Oesophagostomum dentatum]
MPMNSIILALPQSFQRAATEIADEPTVRFVIYSHLADMAEQLNKISISDAIVWVWPDRMPRSDQMRMVMQAVERHLHSGGTLDCFPPPFEKSRREDWEDLQSVCTEAVRMLTGPARGFDARVIDHYGPLGDEVPKFHLTMSLGVSPRKGGDKFHGWQILVFLEQLRQNKKGRKRSKPPELMYLRDQKIKKQEQPPHMKQRGREPH